MTEHDANRRFLRRLVASLQAYPLVAEACRIKGRELLTAADDPEAADIGVLPDRATCPTVRMQREPITPWVQS